MGSICSILMRGKVGSQQYIENDVEDTYRSDLTFKILILGTPNSGKSTILRQMQIINTSGFSLAERQMYKGIIWENVIGCTKKLIMISETEGILPFDEETREAIHEFNHYIDIKTHMQSSGDQMRLLSLSCQLCSSIFFRGLFEGHTGEFECPESMAYFLNEIDNICCEDFIPSDKHILHSRLRTVGVRSLKFFYKDLQFQIVDVGGQRSERRKWIHQFDDVKILLFCVSANEFDVMLDEEPAKNAMEESVEVFNSIINSYWFKSTHVVLFLNKVDLLEKKLNAVEHSNHDGRLVDGPKQLENVLTSIKETYMNCNQKTERTIYLFNTCATNTENITFVSRACLDIFIKNNLMLVGLY